MLGMKGNQICVSTTAPQDVPKITRKLTERRRHEDDLRRSEEHDLMLDV